MKHYSYPIILSIFYIAIGFCVTCHLGNGSQLSCLVAHLVGFFQTTDVGDLWKECGYQHPK
jgi:hypothetical protein